ncbi:UTP6 [Candida theae]|uniref:UTP6 n=1 Tax=Candida theae TaxID=1198502 RepID=A0AAD5BC58_9ASCO|nr:UTP6 [Candida theae]KAI5950012.1 UTP6 [Candida theae]
MADKVRYYLEQSVPELEDLKVKGLFDKNEITMIMRRRTDFEHRITGRGSRPRDFLKYSEFENNLEKLRKKRYARLSKVGLVDTKASISDWAGVRRIMFILDRGTKRFPGDQQLWAEYLSYAKENGAIKVIYKIYSRLLQLQPRNIDAWLSAAKYEFEVNGNAKGTRLLFQRGLRLNPESTTLWLSYAQFELTYISKLLARRKLLGLLTETEAEEKKETEDMMVLPQAETKLNLPDADMNMLGSPETNPALKGDVFLAIFDECAKARGFEAVEKFLQLIDQFEDLDRDYLYNHVLNYIQREYPDDIRTIFIDITLPIRTTNDGLQLSVNKFLAYKAKSPNKELTNMFVNRLMQVEGNDKIKSLIQAIIKKINLV